MSSNSSVPQPPTHPDARLRADRDSLPPNAWKPFGNGARACIGRPFATQEAQLVLSMMLRRSGIRRWMEAGIGGADREGDAIARLQAGEIRRGDALEAAGAGDSDAERWADVEEHEHGRYVSDVFA
jgi:hypothetical protein